jgi:hypothetical protein
METLKLTDQQGLSIAELPEGDRVIGVDRSAPFVRKPTGQILRIQQDGNMTAATVAARSRLTDRRAHQAVHVSGGVQATSLYTSVME